MLPSAIPPPKGENDSLKSKTKWLILRPSPLSAAFTCLVIIVMFGLGAFIIENYRSLQLQSHGKVGSAYIDNLLAPYALSYLGGVDEVSPRMEPVFSNLTEEDSQLLLRIWRLDGTLFYSTFATNAAALHDSEDLDIPLAGQFVAKLETSGVVDADFPMSSPFFEVYAPIHDPITGDAIAIGEIYQDASEILRDRAFVERTVWAAISFATLGVLAMLALSFSQSAQLQDRLEVARRMTEQNGQLRRDADQARLDAAQANEQVLNIVGAELHDGPVQLLGLMSLMGSDNTQSGLPDGTTLHALTDQVMMELRTMSAGLILPELEYLNAADVVTLAVERHQALTGGKVELEMELKAVELDLPRKICLYRVVQEGLTNAARHGDAEIPHVSVKPSGAKLDILISSGRSKLAEASPEMPAWRLGLHGMRRRLEAFGGTLVLDNAINETKLIVTLPINMPFPAPVHNVS